MNILATLILAVACCNAYVGVESHFVCKEIDEVFTSYPAHSGPSYPSRRAGKRGEKSGIREIGMKGQKGDEGTISYDLVNKTLKEYVSENEREQDLRISNLEASLARVEEQLREKNKQVCPISYNNKSYIPMRDTERNIPDGKEICARMFGKLFEVSDKAQLDYLMKALRSTHMVGSTVTDFWTGMTINPRNGEVKLSDGRRAPYLRWYPGTPYSSSSTRTNIVLRVHKSPSNTYQYMYNDIPSYRNYFLCEI